MYTVHSGDCALVKLSDYKDMASGGGIFVFNHGYPVVFKSCRLQTLGGGRPTGIMAP